MVSCDRWPFIPEGTYSLTVLFERDFFQNYERGEYFVKQHLQQCNTYSKLFVLSF